MFGKLQQPSTLTFLRAYPTLQAARSASVEELTALLKQARYPGARKAAQQMAERLQQPCLHASAAMTRAKARLMVALLDQLESLIKQIADYDKEIERLFLMHAESGDDRSRYDSASSWQALAGTSPVLFQSGTYQKAHQRLGCIKPWRNVLHQFGGPSTHQEAWAKEYYQRKRAEGKSHSVAVRAMANVWARILYALWKKKEPYQTTTFEQAQHAHAPRVA